MRFITQIFLLTCLFLSLSVNVFAQPGHREGNPEERAEKQTAQMIENLDLTEEQTVFVKEINLANALKFQQARKEAAGDPSKMRPLMQALREEKNAHLKVILTEKQFKKWEEIQAEQSRNRRW